MTQLNSQCYHGLLLENSTSDPFYQNYWASGETLGSAIEVMLSAATLNEMNAPELRMIDPDQLDPRQSDIERLHDTDVFYCPIRHYFPPEPSFSFPIGIVPSFAKGDVDPDDIIEGFSREPADDGLWSVEVNVDRSNLLDTYDGLLGLFDSIRVFWYELHDHAGDEEDVFLTNEALSQRAAIIEHITNNPTDSLENGWVTLTAYVEDGATNINISDHKRIIVKTYSTEIAEFCARFLLDADFPERSDLIAIDNRIHHWHYRQTKSRPHDELAQYLRQDGFSDWNPGS